MYNIMYNMLFSIIAAIYLILIILIIIIGNNYIVIKYMNNSLIINVIELLFKLTKFSSHFSLRFLKYFLFY